MKKKYVITCTLLILMCIIWMHIALYWINHENSNIHFVAIYVLSIVGFLLSFLVIDLLIRRKWKTEYLIWAAFIGGAIIVVDWFFKSQFEENEIEYELGMFTTVPKTLWGVSILIVLISIVKRLYKDSDITKPSLYLAYGYSVVITFWSNLILNPFSDNLPENGFWNGVLRSTYLVQTIYNTYDGVPYTYDTTGLYGHYGLFFLPLQFVGGANSFFAIAFFLAVLACFQQLALCYILDTVSKKRWMGALLAIGGVVRWVSYCPAITIIRPLFPMVLAAFFVKIVKENKDIGFKQYLTFIIILTCATLWNLESSVACIIGTVAFLVLDRIRRNAFMCGKTFFEAIGIIIVPVLCALLIVNLYNIICDGPLIFRAFFFPILGTGEKINNIVTVVDSLGNPRIGNSAWKYLLCFYLGMICLSYWNVKYDNNDSQSNSPYLKHLIGAMAMMGLVLMTYYMNEALWNCLMPVKQLTFAMFAIFLGGNQYVLNFDLQNENNLKKMLRVISLLIVLVCSFYAVMIITDPVRIYARNKGGAYDRSTYMMEINEINDRIPEDTYAVGLGTTIMFHQIGREEHNHFRDTSGWLYSSEDTFKAGIDEIIKHDTVLINDSDLDYEPFDKEVVEAMLMAEKSYKKIMQFNVGNNIYTLYSRHIDG